MTASSSDDDRGAGLIGTIGGVLVVLLFLTFSVQLLVSLYTNTTVTAIAIDAAQRAAGRDANRSPAGIEAIEADAERALRSVNGNVDFSASRDDDGDGEFDVIVVSVTADAPRFIPGTFGGELGFESISETVTLDVEDFVEDAP